MGFIETMRDILRQEGLTPMAEDELQDPARQEPTPEATVSPSPVEALVVEPASLTARPIYWEVANGRILGPGVPECLAQVGSEFWIVVTFAAQPRWIRSDRLRSRKAFEQQPEVRKVERIPEGLF